ncbi:hypothetical protein ACIHIX_46860 [Streptomyces sp. NPDC051913]|uniref:hypothetical protein n=1 Tax=Streptomyces sp. NPDC051913 TaxID=3365676 RepID=UPI0037D96218
MTTQEQLDASADDLARELGTHDRTAELTDHHHGLGRLITDGDSRVLRLTQPDDRRPDRLTIHAALPDETTMTAPSTGLTARNAPHMARDITRRLYPLHTETAQQAPEPTARQHAQDSGRRAVAETAAGTPPGAQGRGAVPAPRRDQPLRRSHRGLATAAQQPFVTRGSISRFTDPHPRARTNRRSQKGRMESRRTGLADCPATTTLGRRGGGRHALGSPQDREEVVLLLALAEWEMAPAAMAYTQMAEAAARRSICLLPEG